MLGNRIVSFIVGAIVVSFVTGERVLVVVDEVLMDISGIEVLHPSALGISEVVQNSKNVGISIPGGIRTEMEKRVRNRRDT